MSTVFERQEEARIYVNSIQEPKEGLAIFCAFCRVFSFLTRDDEYVNIVLEQRHPLDVFVYVRALHAFLNIQNAQQIFEILDGKYSTLNNLLSSESDASISNAFNQQKKARQYINGIQNPQDKMLVQCALNRAIAFLIQDEDYRNVAIQQKHLLDLYLYVRTAHAFLNIENRELIEGIFSGKYKTIDDIDRF